MTLQDAYNFFERLKSETTKKSEIKVYNNFLHILSKLKDREFSNDEIQSIETELENLRLESNLAKNSRQLNKILKEFKEYLKENHSLISAGYYTNIAMSTGITFGVVLGVLIGERFEKSLGLAVGISIGMIIGLIIGRNLDSKAESENRML